MPSCSELFRSEITAVGSGGGAVVVTAATASLNGLVRLAALRGHPA